MKCPKCQSDNPETAKFFAECGANITSVDDAQPSFTKTLKTPVETLTRGTLFAGRYEIIEELGQRGPDISDRPVFDAGRTDGDAEQSGDWREYLVVFLYAAKSDLFVLPCFFDEIIETFVKLLWPIPGRIDVSDSDSPVSRGIFLIVIPDFFILFYGLDNIRGKFEFFFQYLLRQFLNCRVDFFFLQQPAESFNAWL